ncbi:MAG: HAMP domain-containing protein [Acidimicrobiia bacterium]|nr:HAMP domain-containing protein [Acidimicrobiia bacterium]
MKKRLIYGSAILLLAFLTTLLVWQGSFSVAIVGAPSAEQTFLLWAISTLIFILTMTVGFMLFRTGVKLYIERQKKKEGSRLRTKLVIGALALSFMPVIFLVLFSISVLNHNINKWFSRPVESVLHNLSEVSQSFDRETALRARAQALWLSQSPDVGVYLATGVIPPGFPGKLCREQRISEAWLERDDGTRLKICAEASEETTRRRAQTAVVPMEKAKLHVKAFPPLDLAAKQELIDREVREYQILSRARKEFRWTYIGLLLLISLFILFVATWIALFLSRQISEPIASLLEAAGELRRGNLAHRIKAAAVDELGTLVRAFNEMSQELEFNEKELERRHQFTEAILESIPTGVISLSAERGIQRVNGALAQMFPAEQLGRAAVLEDLFPEEHAREIHYLLNRARRMGLASTQMEMEQDRHTLHLAITVAALTGRHSSGWVLVIEDTSELLRAQKAAAWHEVARRIAHELKNPLTPIALSSERIARQIDRLRAGEEVHQLPAEVLRILRECSLTISGEVQSVKTLVDEFSQFARFPAAQPALCDLNEVVENALQVFNGRLDGIEIRKSLSAALPPVSIDREQFKRVVVNLVDNAAEAMRESALRQLSISTQLAGQDTVELVVADTGAGISAEDRDRLFLPYFSTKERGTGLGLAIVHHILSDHGAQIRVEENPPSGSRFVVEIPAPQVVESEARAV